MRTEVWEVNPARAAELLATMRRNRTVTTYTVDRYARAMSAGRWQLNGATLSVMQNGDGTVHLLNGAHRLNAVIKSGTTQKFLVAFEDNESVFTTFDTGRNRSTATILALSGQSNANVVSALSRVLLMYRAAPDIAWNSRANIVTGDEIVAWHESLSPDELDELNSAGNLAGELRRHVRSAGSWYGALVWLIRSDSALGELLPDFHTAVCDGAGLAAGDPRLALRNYVINAPLLRGSAGDLSRQAALAIGIKAWNDWMNGDQKTFYKFQIGRVLNGKRIQTSLPMPSVK